MSREREIMSVADQSAWGLLGATGGDTVKLFDVSGKSGDPCVLSYTPTAGSHVNSLKWNHTNLVVASAGDDRKISLWRTNGHSLGTIPVSRTETADNNNIDESILAISFSNKASRYICTGGTAHVVRIWDLQRKRCIKWLKGHTNTITGAMYNCKDEHLASISLSGDLILHNLASGARNTELKDPHQQVLRVLDYSRISRHLLVTAGDDGTVHLWDTTGRGPKVSWLKQHSAPTAGISFSPSNDKVIASIGLDKKLFTYDSGSRRPSSCISYEAPFSSLAYRDDGWVLAAGTSTGRVVFYDVRGKPEPFTVLKAYNTSEAVTSLCWQRSKPVIVNESICSAETALLGDSFEDSILMPDPLPSVLLHTPAVEETPQRTHLRPGGPLPRLHPPRLNYNFKDEMDVFSPLVDVQPITPGLDKFVDDLDRSRKEHPGVDKKSSSIPYPSSTRRFPFTKDGGVDPPMFDWKPTSILEQDDVKPESTPSPSTKSENSITPPEAWGGEKQSDKYTHIRTLPSRLGMFPSNNQPSSSVLPGLPDLPAAMLSQMSIGSGSNSNFSYANPRTKDMSLNKENSLGLSESFSMPAVPISSSTKGVLGGPANHDPLAPSTTRRFSTYAERISTTSSFSDGMSPSLGSPKIKKTGAEPRELFNSCLPKSDTSSASIEIGGLPMINGGMSQSHLASQQEVQQQGNSFTLQLFQRTLEETLDSVQKSVRDDIRNLHIELLRQFHMHEMETEKVQNRMLEELAELRKEVKSLKKEYQEVRQLL